MAEDIAKNHQCAPDGAPGSLTLIEINRAWEWRPDRKQKAACSILRARVGARTRDHNLRHWFVSVIHRRT